MCRAGAARSYVRPALLLKCSPSGRSLRARISCGGGRLSRPCAAAHKSGRVSARARERPVLGFELALDGREDLERAVEHGRVVCRHDARAQQRAVERDAG